MEIETLQAELERLFDLKSLLELTREVLGFDPESIGGTAALGSFAQSLIRHCIQCDATEALCDAIRILKPNSSPNLDRIRTVGLSFNENLAPGAAIGDIQIVRVLGQGRVGASYLGQYGPTQVRVKVLRHEATRDRRGLQRFAAVTRLVARISHPALPAGLVVATAADRVLIVHNYIEGQTLGQRLARSGPIHITEALPILQAILDPLTALHEQRLAHGDLRLENILVYRDAAGAPRVQLLDAATDRLRARPRDAADLESAVISPKSIAPEVLSGAPMSVVSDVYALGVVVYEMLTGQPPFTAVGFDATHAHLHEQPQPPSLLAPRGWANRELDEFVLALLAKDPQLRPQHAQAVIDRIGRIGRFPSMQPVPAITDEDFARRLEAMALDPESVAAMAALDEALNDGADPERIASTFRMAALDLEAASSPQQLRMRKDLFLRSAQIYEHTLRDLEKAETMYLWALNSDPSDTVALRSLERVRRGLGKFEEIIETLLGRTEEAQTAEERGRTFFEIGKIYRSELGDMDQALVAFTQAFCEEPEKEVYAEEIEKIAGDSEESWAEVLDSCNASIQDTSVSPEAKKLLMVRVGRWYADKLQRPDLALPCFQTVVGFDAGNEAALEAMAQLYRKSQQWQELGMVLSRWADAVKMPARARDLRTDAGELAERQLNDLPGARALYEAVLADDPTHERASDGLCRVTERSGDFQGLIKILQLRADALRGDDYVNALVKVAEVYETRLNNDAEAIKLLEKLLAENPGSVEVMRALDRVYAKVGRFNDLIANLERQVQIATTPRQKTQLFERIAAVYEEEFLDNAKAAQALQSVLGVDPNHEGALSSLTRIERALGNWGAVAELLERHLSLVTEPARKITLALQLGRVLAEQLQAADRAMQAFEQVLSFEPQHAEALEMVARLRASLGDADAALAAIDVLAAKATSPQAKAEHFWRAARLLEDRGDLDQAISYYKQILDTVPDHPATAVSLREAYLKRGDPHAAVQLLDQEIQRTEGDRAKAKLLGEKASILHHQLHESTRAEEAAKGALSRDPTNADALMVLGDVAFDAGRFIEASKHFAPLIDRVESLPKSQAARALVRSVESLAKAESFDRAQAAADALARLAPDDLDAQLRAAKALFEKGDPTKTSELMRGLLERCGERCTTEQRASLLYSFGESLRRAGNPSAAIEPLEEAIDLDPNAHEPLVALASAFEQLGRWNDVVKTKYRHLDIAMGDDRVQLLIDLGDIIAEKFKDRPKAIQSLVAALEDRPDDRKLLTKLMQLYGDEKDWTRLVDVVMRLAGFVDEPKQRAKYLHTAAIVQARQMGQVDEALELLEQVIELDPTLTKAFSEAIELNRSRKDFTAVERLLRGKLERAVKAEDVPAQIEIYSALAELYERDLGWVDYALTALESAAQLEPKNLDRTKHIAELAARDPAHHLERALQAYMKVIMAEPQRLVETYRTMRRLHTETKNADGAWCLCQSLAVLGYADPDEERFYKRMRAETAAPAQAVFTEPDWLAVTHGDTDPLLTSLFALIEPAVLASRTPELSALGHPPSQAIDLAQTPAPMTQTLYYAAGVMGIAAPPAFVIRDDPGGLSFLHARTPGIGLGRVAMSDKVPPQAAAFIAARHLSFTRPGFYLRQLLGNPAGLKAWLFAAIKLISPQFPLSPDMEGPVREAMSALDTAVRGSARDELARLVTTLLRDGAALDLKKWVTAVDLSADRAGFVLAHDLETAAQIIKASDDSSSAIPRADRLRLLALFAVSPEYLGLRERLRIRVDS
jgi:tetratricopeptide (TPR) repeat protein/tRNA A-37 threonylcarbamoyl transferase component Bud32